MGKKKNPQLYGSALTPGLYKDSFKIKVLSKSWRVGLSWKSSKGFQLCAWVWFSLVVVCCFWFFFFRNELFEGLWPLLECGKLNSLLPIDRHRKGYSNANLFSFQTLSLDTFCLESEGKEQDVKTGVSWVLGSKHPDLAFVPVISESGAAVWDRWGLRL